MLAGYSKEADARKIGQIYAVSPNKKYKGFWLVNQLQVKRFLSLEFQFYLNLKEYFLQKVLFFWQKQLFFAYRNDLLFY